MSPFGISSEAKEQVKADETKIAKDLTLREKLELLEEKYQILRQYVRRPNVKKFNLKVFLDTDKIILYQGLTSNVWAKITVKRIIIHRESLRRQLKRDLPKLFEHLEEPLI